MATRSKQKRLLDAYRFPGFRPLEQVRGLFGDPQARVITLVRRSKKHAAAPAVERIADGTTAGYGRCAICRAGDIGSTWSSKRGACRAEAARP
jgi:hypothetical protein